MSENNKVNYGPLTGLIGVWQGNKGKDVAPDPDDVEINNYYETITFTEASEVTNAEFQVLSAVHYIQKVQRIDDDKVIHHETGYWMWNQDSNEVMHSLVIPRGISVLAGGTVNEIDCIKLNVQASIENKDWKLIQSPFMNAKAKLTSYSQQIVLTETSLYYTQTMMVDIYGKKVEHTDHNTLLRK